MFFEKSLLLKVNDEVYISRKYDSKKKQHVIKKKIKKSDEMYRYLFCFFKCLRDKNLVKETKNALHQYPL